MQKPASFGTGVSGTSVSAATVATTKYSVATSFRNRYGDRYAAIHVSSTQPYTLFVYGSERPVTSHVDNAVTGTVARLLQTSTGHAANVAATSPAGLVHYVRIAGNAFILPMITQSSGSNATVSISYQTFNE